MHLTFFNEVNIAFSLTNCESKKVVLFYWDSRLCFSYISQVFFGGRELFSVSLENKNAEDGSFALKRKKEESNKLYPGSFALKRKKEESNKLYPRCFCIE